MATGIVFSSSFFLFLCCPLIRVVLFFVLDLSVCRGQWRKRRVAWVGWVNVWVMMSEID